MAHHPPQPTVSLRAAERFCVQMLPRVSRTFALSIRFLPGSLGRAVLTAYLLCRIADTVEDAPGLEVERKAELLDLLIACFEDEAAVAAFVDGVRTIEGPSDHVQLTRSADRVFLLFGSLPPRSRQRVQHWVGEMVRGMRKFVQLYPRGIRIQTLEEYREYCYYVAGTVGHLLTDLWHEHSSSIGVAEYRALWKRCRAFGEALQTVNILKDIAWDAQHENSIYIPQQTLRAHGSDHQTLLSPAYLRQNHQAIEGFIELAWRDLDDALEYVLSLPRRALSIRAFCVLPLLFAYATLRDLARSTAMLRPGETVKISRAEVRSLMVVGLLLVLSNRSVRWLVGKVRARPFVLLPRPLTAPAR